MRVNPRRSPDAHKYRRSDNGAIAAFVVLIMVGLLALLGLVVDGGSDLTAHQAAQVEAEQAARAGAGALSIDALRDGETLIDAPAAIAAAERFMAEAGHPGSAVLSGGVVTVHIRYQVPTAILGLIGINWLDVSAAAAAVDIGGVTRGGP
jgi:Flp pilus assembly protein TadG